MNLPLKTLTRIFCLFFSCCKLYMLILPPHITIIWSINCYFNIKKWYLKSWKQLFEDEIWHLNSENCNLNMKFGIWILKIIICNSKVIFQSKFCYLIMKIDISLLKILIWISKVIFENSKLLFEFRHLYFKSHIFFGIQNLIFQSQNWYLSS
jgi:hypothetical protein